MKEERAYLGSTGISMSGVLWNGRWLEVLYSFGYADEKEINPDSSFRFWFD